MVEIAEEASTASIPYWTQTSYIGLLTWFYPIQKVGIDTSNSIEQAEAPQEVKEQMS